MRPAQVSLRRTNRNRCCVGRHDDGANWTYGPLTTVYTPCGLTTHLNCKSVIEIPGYGSAVTALFLKLYIYFYLIYDVCPRTSFRSHFRKPSKDHRQIQVGRETRKKGRTKRTFRVWPSCATQSEAQCPGSGNISNPTLSHLIATCLAGCCPSDKFKNVRRIPGQDITHTQLTIKPTNQPPPADR